MSGLLVLDANIGVKALVEEADSEAALTLWDRALTNNAPMVCPHHFAYELLSVAAKRGSTVSAALAFLGALEKADFRLQHPSASMWLRAEEIAGDGHPKAGYPSLYDSIYQAMALELGGTFVTADQKHYDKAKKHGGIAILS